MKPSRTTQVLALAVGALVLGSMGCATKKYVRQSLDPLEVNLKKNNQQIADNSDQIRDVDHRAETGISEAQNSAQQANQAAGTADQHAQAAHDLAQQGVSAANQAQDMVNNIDNYKPAQHATVLFGLNKSTLTDPDKARLDNLVSNVKQLKHYVLQVQGYTDKTGPRAYNIALSQRRADAVVRYLTLNGDIPLVRIYNLGYGEAAPAADNATRAGRKQNRRVDVTIMVPQMPGSQATSMNGGGPSQ